MMKTKLTTGLVCVLLCLASGVAGAYFMFVLEARRPAQANLQVRKLELIDGNKRVRGRLALEDNGTVTFRLLSNQNVPTIELTSTEDNTNNSSGSPSGSLTIRHGSSIPVIQLGTVRGSEGVLLFSSSNTRGQVAVGYQPYGDVVDGIDRGTWGIQVKGPNHESTGVGVYTEDGKAIKFVGPH